MPLAQRALTGLAHRSEGINKEVIKGLASLHTPSQPIGAGIKLIVRELLQFGLDRINRFDRLRKAF